MNEVKNLSAFPGIAADGRLIKPRDPFAYAQCDGKIGKNADKSEYIF